MPVPETPDFNNSHAIPVWSRINDQIMQEIKTDSQWMNKAFRENKKTLREAGLKKAARSGSAFALCHIPVIGPVLSKVIGFIPAEAKNDGKELQMASYYVDRIDAHLKDYWASMSPDGNKGYKDQKKLAEFKNILINIVRASVELEVAQRTIDEVKSSVDSGYQQLFAILEQDASPEICKLLPAVEIEMTQFKPTP
ncbi:hypothetical protein SG34_007640 [Thalassomonas viridans]|uniref:Uncharacterized protein n=1 Tax=Thalassomonas viridans TaxID=137584 RepID=A0AAF0CAW9_9GAMM|nr:hypothetical protein [Thalassomonas viridans]WDE06765.1 hypothetical protein SG34_007640 [Thalassomonas viridans]